MGIGPNRIFALLREMGILMTGKIQKNLPYQEYQYRGCFTVVESTVLVKGKTWLRFTPRLTGKGQ